MFENNIENNEGHENSLRNNYQKKRPRMAWRVEVNTNTLVSVITLITVVLGLGVQYEFFKETLAHHSDQIASLLKDDSDLSTEATASANTQSLMQLRVTSLETANSQFSSLLREHDKDISDLTSDIKVIKEIVTRLEDDSRKRQNGQ